MTAALASASDGTSVGDQINATFRLRASSLVSLEVDAAPEEAFDVTIPIGGRDWTLRLWPHSVRGAGFRVFHQIEGGGLIEVDPGPVRTLRGDVAGAPGSRVSGSLLEDGLHASIEIGGAGHWWIEPIASFVPGVAANTYVLYRAEDVIPSQGTCATPHPLAGEVTETMALARTEGAGTGGSDGGHAAGSIAGGETCNFVTELACDADYPYYQDWGASTEARVELVINSMNDQYEDEVQITHEITAIIVRTSDADDPYSSNNPDTLLGQFRSHWLANHPDIQRDVAHLFTGRDLQGSVIGIAWTIGAICTNGAYCLAQSDCCCCPSFACSTDLSAHELGHLWGAFHCSCPGWTMNASLTCANQFTAGSISSIVAHRDSRTCLVDACEQQNDECWSPQPVLAGTTPFANVNATTSTPEESCEGAAFVSDVWFRYTATCTGTLTVGVCNTTFDTVIGVYEYPCPSGPGEVIACNDDFCAERSQLAVDVSDGGFYAIRVGGLAGAEGTGELSVSLACAPECPADLDGSGEVDVSDLTFLILAWGTADPDVDLNGDGTVDVGDLTQLILAWGACG